MLKNKSIAVVVPCYNEELQVVDKVIKTMPDFVDLIIIVNDKSKDNTEIVVKDYINNNNSSVTNFTKKILEYSANPYDKATNVLVKIRKEEEQYYTPSEVYQTESSKVVLISHKENGGVGAAIASGYKYARDHHIDCTAVMAGDGQMDPAELESICMPVVDERVDYSKGNRLSHKSAKRFIPKIRYFGNSVLSILTKIASGYWRISDTQTGYTAISLEALENIDIYDIYKSYGMPNDLLVKLNIASFKITEVPIKPVYHVGEESKMKISKVIPKVSWLLLKLFFERMFKKYLLKDFHPLFLLYFLSFLTFIISIPIGFKFWFGYLILNDIAYGHLILHLFLATFSFQSLIFAMWFDMQDNERLYEDTRGLK